MTCMHFNSVKRIRRNGEVWDIPLKPGINLLIGRPNVSKTTTLEIISFCLGHRDAARKEFIDSIVQEYEYFELDITIGDSTHVIRRHLHTSGMLSLCEVDGIAYDSDSFQRWLGDRLNWTGFKFPKGRNYAIATEEVSLTFRSVLRHLYRNASSWASFAAKEDEIFRRAVTAFLLGIADEFYAGQDVQQAKGELEKRSLESRRLQLKNTLDSVVRRVTDGFRVQGITTFDTLPDVIAEIDLSIANTTQQLRSLRETIRSRPELAVSQDETLASLRAETREAESHQAALSEAVAEQRKLAVEMSNELLRLGRAKFSATVLSGLRVTQCPACLQSIDAGARSQHLQPYVCYVCSQPVSEDTRVRRLELEEATLKSELEELTETIGSITSQVEAIRARRAFLTEAQSALLTEMEAARETFISPYLQEFELLQRQLGQLEQRRASLDHLRGLQELISSVDDQLYTVETKLLATQQRVTASIPDYELIRERTDKFSSEMNRFLSLLPGDHFGTVTQRQDDLDFMVGVDRWNLALGNEWKILFLLAYHFAQFKMLSDGLSPHPGFVILDNPFQHGIEESLVIRALQMFSELLQQNDSFQMIVTARKPLPSVHATVYQFTNPSFLPADPD